MGVGIHVEKLNAWYGKSQALYDINLKVAANHATALSNEFWSLRLNQPSSALPLQIYKYANTPYDDLHRQAWAGALVLIILIVTSIAAVRYAVRRGSFGAA